LGRFAIGDKRLKAEQIAEYSESAHLAEAYRGNQGVRPERFTRIDVGQVDLNGRQSGGLNGIADSDTGMGVRGGINQDGVILPLSLPDPFDDTAFMV
jgi:hypothetical protein